MSFTGEKRAIDKYNESLEKAATASVHQGFATGLGMGILNGTMFSAYSLGIWYGGRLILNNGYDGGRVLTVIFALLTASM